jgi:aminoglycoside phosphotransferase (APT) family kinase protein
MQPLDALQALLGHAADFGVAECLADSPVSTTWLVTAAGRRAVLRVDRPLAARLALPRATEPGVLRAAADAGLGPRVLAADPARGLLLTEWLPGAVLQAGALETPDLLPEVAALLRAVHASPIQGPRLDLVAVIDRYASLGGPTAAGPATEARHLLKACRASPGLPPAFCHNDPSPANILACESNGLRLIDWEYAGHNHPEFDLAVFAAEARLAPVAAMGLLAGYLGRPPEPPELARQAAWLAFYRVLAVLWSVAVLPRAPPS